MILTQSEFIFPGEAREAAHGEGLGDGSALGDAPEYGIHRVRAVGGLGKGAG